MINDELIDETKHAEASIRDWAHPLETPSMLTKDLLIKHHSTAKFKQNLNFSKVRPEEKYSIARISMPMPMGTLRSQNILSIQLNLSWKKKNKYQIII